MRELTEDERRFINAIKSIKSLKVTDGRISMDLEELLECIRNRNREAE